MPIRNPLSPTTISFEDNGKVTITSMTLTALEDQLLKRFADFPPAYQDRIRSYWLSTSWCYRHDLLKKLHLKEVRSALLHMSLLLLPVLITFSFSIESQELIVLPINCLLGSFLLIRTSGQGGEWQQRAWVCSEQRFTSPWDNPDRELLLRLRPLSRRWKIASWLSLASWLVLCYIQELWLLVVLQLLLLAALHIQRSRVERQVLYTLNDLENH